MGYTPPPGPTHKEKEMFIIGIVIGAMFSFLGSYIVAFTFRAYDYGHSVENAIFIIVPPVALILILIITPRIIKRLW